jgi:hypothetical protein
MLEEQPVRPRRSFAPFTFSMQDADALEDAALRLLGLRLWLWADDGSEQK